MKVNVKPCFHRYKDQILLDMKKPQLQTYTTREIIYFKECSKIKV